nr:hypothetical protein GCM10017547_26810 [Pseudarthrobacter oxydans]
MPPSYASPVASGRGQLPVDILPVAGGPFGGTAEHVDVMVVPRDALMDQHVEGMGAAVRLRDINGNIIVAGTPPSVNGQPRHHPRSAAPGAIRSAPRQMARPPA